MIKMLNIITECDGNEQVWEVENMEEFEDSILEAYTSSFYDNVSVHINKETETVSVLYVEEENLFCDIHNMTVGKPYLYATYEEVFYGDGTFNPVDVELPEVMNAAQVQQYAEKEGYSIVSEFMQYEDGSITVDFQDGDTWNLQPIKQ